MKKTLLLVAALFYFVGLNAQGVIFEKGTWKEVLEKANRENKIIFVDIYTSWCGPCKNVAKTVFPNAEFGAYYNEHFINFQVDAEKGEGPAFVKTYPATGYPTFYYINGKGEVLRTFTGAKNVHEFVQEGKMVNLTAKYGGMEAMKKTIEAGKADRETISLYYDAAPVGEKPFAINAVLTNDASKLYYLSAFEGGYDLWVRDFKNGSTRMLSKLNKGGGALVMSKDGRNLYLLSGGQISKVDMNSGQLKGMSYNAEFEWKKPEERAYLFDHVWQQVVDKFYDPAIHNIDWAFYKKEYARFLPYINNNYDFAEMLAELLGELNASHTGASYKGGGSSSQTAALGVFYDETFDGDGLKIKEILEKGPLDLTSGKIKPGMIIRKINNQEIKKGQDYFQILEGLSGKRVMLTIYDPSTKKEWEEYVKPTTYGNQNGLLYNRWVKQRQEMVEKLSNGKIGYVHVKSMDSPSFRKVYSEILGKYRNKEAIIVDTRYNGGGWLHEDLLHLLSGKKYAEFVPRGQFIGEDPFTQWNKPSAVLVSESNYSNAHGFPWAYKELGLGKVIGMPVPGTMTAVWWETLMDPSLVFGIPQVGMKDNQGRILENMQLEPDIKVTNDPASAMKGRDLQLEAAVESLMKEIK